MNPTQSRRKTLLPYIHILQSVFWASESIFAEISSKVSYYESITMICDTNSRHANGVVFDDATLWR